MALLLTASGEVKCGHGGTAQISGEGKLTVNGAAVMCESDVTSWVIPPGCSQTTSDTGQVPCATLQSVTGGTSSKLTVGGSKVLLASMTAVSKEGKPANDVSATDAGQDKVTAV